MKYKLSDINITQKGKILVPDIIHFVWIGDTNQINTAYINIWKETNKDKKIFFWHDNHSSLCHMLHEAIRNFVTHSNIENKEHEELRIKNNAFNYVFPRLKKGYSFNKLILDFLTENSIPYHGPTNLEPNPWLKDESIIKKSITELFDHDFSEFMKYYYYEIILRDNLASASDIVRLLIIFLHGGTYMDVDALPYMDNIYEKSNRFIRQEKVFEDDLLFLFKTKSILKKTFTAGFSRE